MINLFLLYFPAVVVRYSLQLISIILPWIMQLRNVEIADIAHTFYYFFLGCFVGSTIIYLRYMRRPMVRMLKLSLVAQSLLFLLCFFIQDPAWLRVVRFFHGVSIGLFRPTNQIWVNEFEKVESRISLTQRAVYNKTMIAVGIFFGGVVGTFAKVFISSTFWAVFYGVFFYLTPIIILNIVLLRSNPKVLPHVLENAKNEPQTSNSMLTLLKASPLILLCFVYQGIAMFDYSFWTLVVPYELRANPAAYGLVSVDDFLMMLLPAHAFVFSFAQFFVTAQLRKFHRSSFLNVQAIACILSLQSILIWVGLNLKGMPYVTFSLLVLGAAVCAAWVYPLLMLVLYDQVKHNQSVLMRKVLVMLSILSDVGQMLGCAFLQFKYLPAVFRGINVFLVPMYLSFFVMLVSFLFLSKKHQEITPSIAE